MTKSKLMTTFLSAFLVWIRFLLCWQ